MRRAHIVGAGLAGLSAALAFASRGMPVTLYESGPAAGGRCRSYFDRGLGCRIDNGNHLLLSGNSAALRYLDCIRARETMGGPGRALFPFIDLADGERWTVAPDGGRIPWWVLSRRRRVPGTGLRHYGALLALRRAGADATVASVLEAAGPLYRRLLEPLAVASLNTPPEIGLARLLNTVIAETLMRGGAACIPMFPREGLSESFVDPALAWLQARGGSLHVGRRIAGLRIASGLVIALQTPDEAIAVGAEDAVILAVPPWVAADLLPGLVAPDAFEAILNVHFRMAAEPEGALRQAGFIGVIGGTAEWIFVKQGIVSVTISAASRMVELPAPEIAARVWADVATVLLLPPSAMPPVRVVKEKRATFAATAAQERRRPGPRTTLRNLALAGDWTATGLPATIEGAIRSGCTAAETLRTA